MFNILLHQSIRSNIIALLINNGEISFNTLKKELNLSDGNLSSHLSKLKNGDCINIEKISINKKKTTIISITNNGREEFKLYINQLKQFIKDNE